MSQPRVAIIGNGYLGKAYQKMFPEAIVYDEPQIREKGGNVEAERNLVNQCEFALVAVPTDLTDGQELDMSIIESVVDWLDADYILIKSALMPGTVDRLVEETGKHIAVSAEFVGEGTYFSPPWKYVHQTDPQQHPFIIVGGDIDTATACAELLWSRMSPDINIHLVEAKEVEIIKLTENTMLAMKVTFANVLKKICDENLVSYINVLQALGEDARLGKMHMRATGLQRGYKSKCLDKDVPALAKLDSTGFIQSIVDTNAKLRK